MALPTFHPATDDDVGNLRLFDASTDPIEATIRNPQEVVANWTKVGVLDTGGKRRAVLVDRSSLSMAFVEGDGDHFGRVRLPSQKEVADAVRQFGLHWE